MQYNVNANLVISSSLNRLLSWEKKAKKIIVIIHAWLPKLLQETFMLTATVITSVAIKRFCHGVRKRKPYCML